MTLAERNMAGPGDSLGDRRHPRHELRSGRPLTVEQAAAGPGALPGPTSARASRPTDRHVGHRQRHRDRSDRRVCHRDHSSRRGGSPTASAACATSAEPDLALRPIGRPSNHPARVPSRAQRGAQIVGVTDELVHTHVEAAVRLIGEMAAEPELPGPPASVGKSALMMAPRPSIVRVPSAWATMSRRNPPRSDTDAPVSRLVAVVMFVPVCASSLVTIPSRLEDQLIVAVGKVMAHSTGNSQARPARKDEARSLRSSCAPDPRPLLVTRSRVRRRRQRREPYEPRARTVGRSSPAPLFGHRYGPSKATNALSQRRRSHRTHAHLKSATAHVVVPGRNAYRRSKRQASRSYQPRSF